MPYKECRADLLNIRFSDISTLKAYWKMSKAAIIRKAKDYGFITQKTYMYYRVELGRSGETKKERIDVDIDQPTILIKVLNFYYSDLNYSKDDLGKALKMYPEEVEKLFLQSNHPKLKLVS